MAIHVYPLYVMYTESIIDKTKTVTAQSPRPTSAPRPDRSNRKKRSRNDEFGPLQPSIDPSQPIVTTSETQP